MKTVLRLMWLPFTLLFLLSTHAAASGEREAAIKAKRVYTQYKSKYGQFVVEGKKKYGIELKIKKDLKSVIAWIKESRPETRRAVKRLKTMQKQGKSISELKKTNEYATYSKYRLQYRKYKKLRADYKKAKPQLNRFYSEWRKKSNKVKVLRERYLKRYAAYKATRGGTSSPRTSVKASLQLAVIPRIGTLDDKFFFTLRGKSLTASAVKSAYLKFDGASKRFALQPAGVGKYVWSKALSQIGYRTVTAYVEFKDGRKKISNKVNCVVEEDFVDLSKLPTARNPQITHACFPVVLSSTFQEWAAREKKDGNGTHTIPTETFLGVESLIGPIKKDPAYNTVYGIAREPGNPKSDKFECVGLIKVFMKKIYKMPIKSMGNGDVVARDLPRRTGTYKSRKIKFTYHSERNAFAPPVIGSVVSEGTGLGNGHVSIVKKVDVERKDLNGYPTKFKAYLFEQNNNKGKSLGGKNAEIYPERGRYITFELKGNKWHAFLEGKVVIGWANAVYM